MLDDLGKIFEGERMQNLITAAKDLGTTIDTFINEAAETRNQALTWLANNERITEETQASLHQLRVLLQTVDAADRRLSQAYSQVEYQPAFKTSGLKQVAELVNYGEIATSAWQIALATISRRGFLHYLDEISRQVSLLDGKLREAEEAVAVWNGKIGDRAAGADVRLAFEGVSHQSQALQGFVLTGMRVITAAVENQTADA